MLNKYKNLIIILVVIVALFFVYQYFLSGKPDTEVLLQQTYSSQTDKTGEQIRKSLNEIRNIKLDTSVFEDPVFNSLIRDTKKINPEPWGRTNIFAPFENSSTNVTSTSTATTTR
jgi:uncharacterized protein YpmS